MGNNLETQMIPINFSNTYDSSFHRFYNKDALTKRSDYVLFKYIFRESLELTYVQRVSILAKVIKSFDDSLSELSQKIVKFGKKCGIALNATASDKAISDHLERITADLGENFFLPGEIYDREKIVERKQCVSKLVPFAYELMRQGKIHKFLDQVIQIFSKCSIELEQESLKNIPEEEPQKFIFEISTQLCSNIQFIQDSPLEAIKYCVPHASWNREIFMRCYSSLKFQLYPYDKIRLLLNETFKSNYRNLLSYFSKVNPSAMQSTFIEYNYSIPLSTRVALAEVIFRINPDHLAVNLFNLFSEKEIVEDFKFSPLLTGLSNDLYKQMEGRGDHTAEYYKIMHLYISAWGRRPFLRTTGSRRVELMLEEKSQGKPFSFEKGLSKDTPIWRELPAMIEEDTREHFFKLDRDFDHTNLRIPYEIQNQHRLKANKTTLELHKLISPALIYNHFDDYFYQWWAPILGYVLWNESCGTYISLPEPARILDGWKTATEDLRAKEKGVYQNLSIGVTQGSATVDEFISLFMKHDVICSMTSEFVHDQQNHLLPTFQAILTSTAEEYIQCTEKAREYIKNGLEAIQEAERKEEYADDLEMLNILKITLGIIVDLHTSFADLEARNQNLHWIFLDSGILTIFGKNEMDFWRNSFSDSGIDIQKYSSTRIQEYWDKIVKPKIS